MKKILSLILTAAMLMSAAVLTSGASEIGIGSGEYAPNMPSFSAENLSQNLDENNVDAQGIYYTLDDETMTAIVGKNTYSDSASAVYGDLFCDSIIIPQTVVANGEEYTVTEIGRNAFDGTEIREVLIPCFGRIGEFAFAGCTKLEYVFTASSEIAGFAFWGCTALSELYVTFADSIGGGAFWNCSSLTHASLCASEIKEKAFEGCTNLEYFVFDGDDVPAVAAGALGTALKAYVLGTTEGWEDFPIPVEAVTEPIIDVENIYARTGDIVEVSVVSPSGLVEGGYEFTVTSDEGVSVVGVLSGADNCCLMENAVLADGVVSGNVLTNLPFTLFVLQVKVGDDTGAGTYEVAVSHEGMYCYTGSVTICDHTATKTVTVKAPSCEEAGVINTVCAACGDILSTDEVEASGHSYIDFVISPTCTEEGYTRHICECCSNAFTDNVLPANGHDWNEGEVIVQVSTTKDGFVKYTCNTCGATENVIIPKLVYGDADGDGKVTLSDASLILKYIAKWDLSETTFRELNADADANGKIVLQDVSLILKYIAKWDVVLGPQS